MRIDRPSLKVVLAVLLAAVMGTGAASAQMPPDSTGAVFAQVTTDKPVYAPGEPVQIQVYAVNAAPDTTRLFFSSSCQADYVIDNQYRFLDHHACLTVLTSRTLAPGETQLIHSFTHQTSDYELLPGPHVIRGEVVGYARNQIRIQVQESPPPPGGVFEVRGAVDPSRGPIGADRNLSCTVTNVGDSTGVFGVDGCPVDWSIDGAYTPNRACPEFFRRIELAPGESITFGPEDPQMIYSPHDFPLGPGSHFVVMDVRGVGADTVEFGVRDPDPALTYLSGRIFESENRPAHTGLVYLTSVTAGSTGADQGPPPTTEMHQATIGEQGWFLFAGIRPGAYYLHAELPEEDAAGNFAARLIWWPGVTDPNQAEPLDLAAGAYRDDIRLTFGSTPPPPQLYPITGRVNEISVILEGSPLAGAVVMAVPTAGVFSDSLPVPGANGETDPAGPGAGNRFVTYTGNDGRFEIRVPAGYYRLVAGDVGHHRYQYWNHVDRFDQASVLRVPEITMPPYLEPRFDLAPLADASVATITGIVLHDDPRLDSVVPRPLEGATVMAVPILPSMVARIAPQRAVTGPDGRYVLNVPADTPYILSAEAPGLDRVYFRNFPDPYSADWVDVAPGDTTAHIDFTLHGVLPPGNTGSIEGSVYRVLPEADCIGPVSNDCSIPAEGAIVHIVPAYPTFAPYEVLAKVGPDGRFRATGIAATREEPLPYYVSAVYPGYEPAYYPGGVSFPDARPLLVYPGRTSDAGIILLGRTSTPPTGGFLAGRIVDPDGNGVDHARVRAFLDPESPGGRVAGGYTDADGRFMITGLPAGTSVLVAADAEGFVPAYYPNAHRWRQAERVVTGGPNLRVVEIDMTLHPAASGGPFIQAGRVRIAATETVDDTTFTEPGIMAMAMAWHRQNLPGAFFYLVNALSASPIDIPVSGGVSAENGAVILTGLPAGVYFAYADRPGYEPAAFQAEGDTGRTPIHLDETTPAVLADIRLQPVSGTVPGTRNGDVSGPVQTLTNAPNPFRPQTVIHFELAEDCPVALQIYDYRGRLVRTLLTGGNQTAGSHEIPWNGTDDAGRRVSSGVYFYRIQAMGHAISRKMVLLP
jgi:hypothetical protein